MDYEHNRIIQRKHEPVDWNPLILYDEPLKKTETNLSF